MEKALVDGDSETCVQIQHAAHYITLTDNDLSTASQNTTKSNLTLVIRNLNCEAEFFLRVSSRSASCGPFSPCNLLSSTLMKKQDGGSKGSLGSDVTSGDATVSGDRVDEENSVRVCRFACYERGEWKIRLAQAGSLYKSAEFCDVILET